MKPLERDEDLAIEFPAEPEATKSPQSLPNSSLQVTDVWQSDPQHPYELLFDPTDVHDVETLSTQVEGIARDRDREPHLPPNHSPLRTERRESTTHVVEHRAATDVVNLHEKTTGTDIRKLLGGPELPKQVQSALEKFGPEARIDQALTHSGIYSGTVIAETVQNLIPIPKTDRRIATPDGLLVTDSRIPLSNVAWNGRPFSKVQERRTARKLITPSWTAQSSGQDRPARRPPVHPSLSFAIRAQRTV